MGRQLSILRHTETAAGSQYQPSCAIFGELGDNTFSDDKLSCKPPSLENDLTNFWKAQWRQARPDGLELLCKLGPARFGHTHRQYVYQYQMCNT